MTTTATTHPKISQDATVNVESAIASMILLSRFVTVVKFCVCVATGYRKVF